MRAVKEQKNDWFKERESKISLFREIVGEKVYLLSLDEIFRIKAMAEKERGEKLSEDFVKNHLVGILEKKAREVRSKSRSSGFALQEIINKILPSVKKSILSNARLRKMMGKSSMDVGDLEGIIIEVIYSRTFKKAQEMEKSGEKMSLSHMVAYTVTSVKNDLPDLIFKEYQSNCVGNSAIRKGEKEKTREAKEANVGNSVYLNDYDSDIEDIITSLDDVPLDFSNNEKSIFLEDVLKVIAGSKGLKAFFEGQPRRVLGEDQDECRYRKLILSEARELYKYTGILPDEVLAHVTDLRNRR